VFSVCSNVESRTHCQGKLLFFFPFSYTDYSLSAFVRYLNDSIIVFNGHQNQIRLITETLLKGLKMPSYRSATLCASIRDNTCSHQPHRAGLPAVIPHPSVLSFLFFSLFFCLSCTFYFFSFLIIFFFCLYFTHSCTSR
jgi:hypothetical protein